MTNIFFCGIGGIGMSALARYAAQTGHSVWGSDSTASLLLQELESEGIKVFLTQRPENIPENCTEFIYSEAIPEDHPERLRARELGIPQKSYFEKLGEISQDFFTICIAGTHGKSGTTVMTGLALEAQGVDPTVFVGTKVFEWGKKNMRRGKSNILLVEACEYCESFLYLEPDVIVLTSIEPDHLDYYQTSEKYFTGFQKFVAKLPAEGMLVADFDLPEVQNIAAKFTGKKVTTGEFLAQVPGLLLPGEHYRQNAARVLALFSALELNLEIAQKSLAKYRGAWRRFEMKGEKNGITVIDDYGHHPTEIQATLKTLCELYPDRKKWVIFQPHQYSRTADFLAEFAMSFSGVQEILIPNIYRVRDTEADLERVSPEILVQEIAKNLASGERVRYTDGFEKTVELLNAEAKSGDVILTLGAGPVHEVGEGFLT